ncbi:MAG: hypothetical protein U1E60_17635 [Reyranellaceae bacterium]
MRWLRWCAIAALVVMAAGCDGENALYRNPKYVPGYAPGGDTAHAYDRTVKADWRQR